MRIFGAFHLLGSSPHARGARHGVSSRRWLSRIIPACAGSTPHRCLRALQGRDHPRMRGEHARFKIPAQAFGGSSPHARGAQYPLPRIHVRKGIIPACAGSTVCVSGSLRQARDHPRMRGEHTACTRSRRTASGSSPHARGAHLSRCQHLARRGIIPACAGSTRIRRRRTARAWDHPRMRGEHTLFLPMSRRAQGSSPHARGARCGILFESLARGIIPACAGSTSPAAWPTRTYRDHPRMRGEHVVSALG